MHDKYQKNYRKRQQEEKSRNEESKKTRMSDTESQRARRVRLKFEASRRQGEQVPDMNVPSTSAVKFDANSISDNINISLCSNRIQIKDLVI